MEHAYIAIIRTLFRDFSKDSIMVTFADLSLMRRDGTQGLLLLFLLHFETYIEHMQKGIEWD